MSGPTRRRIGILLCGYTAASVRAVHGNYDAWFQAMLGGQDFDFEVWPVVDRRFPSGPEEADGWLVSGSPLGVYELHEFLPPLRRLLERIVAAQLPMVGICFGHQAIAQALGGRVEKFAGGWQVGRQTYDVAGLGQVALNTWHQDQVLEAPPGTEVIAQAPGCAIAGLALGQALRTLQPHPEITSACLRALVDARRGTPGLPEAQLDAAVASVATPDDAKITAAWIARVLRGEAA